MANANYISMLNFTKPAAYQAAIAKLLSCLPDDDAKERLFVILEPNGSAFVPVAAELLTLWRFAGAAFNAAAKQPGAENFDSPDCIAWKRIETALTDELGKIVPVTKEDARALLQYALESDGGGDVEVSIPRGLIDNLTLWLDG